MAVLTLTCPHCHTERVAFTSISECAIPVQKYAFTVFFVCGNCFAGVGAKILKDPSHATANPHAVQGSLVDLPGYTVTSVYPKAAEVGVPNNLPDNIGRLFLQAADNLRRKNWDASGAMSRKALDIATLIINPGLKGRLQSRIDSLAENHLITPAMKDWAHAIRLDGNEAAHEDEFDEETAKDLLSFTELFLMYAFTLPGMLEERKQRAGK